MMGEFLFFGYRYLLSLFPHKVTSQKDGGSGVFQADCSPPETPHTQVFEKVQFLVNI